jgi:hypothetical protein
MRVTRLVIVTLVAAIAASAPAIADQPQDLVRSFLHDRMGFSRAEIDDVRAGRPVAKNLRSPGAEDVNIFGALRLIGSPETFVKKIRAIDTYEKSLNIIQVGKFHEPPLLSDLDGLTLEPTDLTALQTCRPGNCTLQLNTIQMDRFRTQINWKAPDATDRANKMFRQLLFDTLETYRHRGPWLLSTYDDGDTAVSPAREFQMLLAPGDTPVELPELTKFLAEYPNATLGEAETFFYWNKGAFGLKPTTRVSQMAIYPVAKPGATSGVHTVIATKQVYSNHYFSATLELRTIVYDPERPGTGYYMFYTTRSRVTNLTGFFGPIIRSIVKSKARSGMERLLQTTKKSVEGK